MTSKLHYDKMQARFPDQVVPMMKDEKIIKRFKGWKAQLAALTGLCFAGGAAVSTGIIFVVGAPLTLLTLGSGTLVIGGMLSVMAGAPLYMRTAFTPFTPPAGWPAPKPRAAAWCCGIGLAAVFAGFAVSTPAKKESGLGMEAGAPRPAQAAARLLQ